MWLLLTDCYRKTGYLNKNHIFARITKHNDQCGVFLISIWKISSIVFLKDDSTHERSIATQSIGWVPFSINVPSTFESWTNQLQKKKTFRIYDKINRAQRAIVPHKNRARRTMTCIYHKIDLFTNYIIRLCCVWTVKFKSIVKKNYITRWATGQWVDFPLAVQNLRHEGFYWICIAVDGTFWWFNKHRTRCAHSVNKQIRKIGPLSYSCALL